MNKITLKYNLDMMCNIDVDDLDASTINLLLDSFNDYMIGLIESTMQGKSLSHNISFIERE